MKGYDAWKTRSDLDDAARFDQPQRCEFCAAPLGEHPWAYWCSDGGYALFCDQCGDKASIEEMNDEPH